MITVKFHGSDELVEISELSDVEIERARHTVEYRIERPLPVDSRTGFPSFTVYEDGIEFGGG
jgi:hypothetical protein